MKVAFAFWGLSRSLKKTLSSIEQNIFGQLKAQGIEYKIFMHVLTLNELYSNPRNHEHGIMLDPNEYTLLKPDTFTVEDQTAVKRQLNVGKYRSHPDPWNTGYKSVDNFICAMYSKHKVTELIQNSGYDMDYVVYLRPDARFINALTVADIVSVNHGSLGVPNFASYNGVNDRFCVATKTNYKIYGMVFKNMYFYSQKYPLHSESFHAWCIKRVGLRIVHLGIQFTLVRANGAEFADHNSRGVKLKKPYRMMVF